MKTSCLIFLLLIQSITYSQTKFNLGFDVGFKKGYCYDQSISCIPPVTPITPFVQLKENANSWQDGYNRGFIIGQHLGIYNQSVNNIPVAFNYSEPQNPVPQVFKSGKYVPPVDLDLLKKVLEYKQILLKTRRNWLQNRSDNLSTLNDYLLTNLDSNYHFTIYLGIVGVIQEINQGYDLTDTNNFYYFANKFKDVELSILDRYNTLKNKQ